MGITFEDVVNYELLNDSTIKLLPNKCRCGKKLVLSDSMRTMRCIDNNCRYFVVDRINKLNKHLELNISAADIDRLSHKLHWLTPYQLFMLDLSYEDNVIGMSDINNIVDVIRRIRELKSQEWYIYEIVELCGIDSISLVAKKLFDGFESIEQLYDELEQGQISFINDRLGIKSSDSSVLTVGIYNKLIEMKEELIFCETLLKIKKYSEKLIRISFCDNNIPFLNKSETISPFKN